MDYGSQYNQLIARAIRENKVHCRITPPGITAGRIKALRPDGIILSGGPSSVYLKKRRASDRALIGIGIPVLGICYGMQLIAELCGGKVTATKKREYGRTPVRVIKKTDIFYGLPRRFTSWMSHGDYVSKMPPHFTCLAQTEGSRCAAIRDDKNGIFGLQFHPEVAHTQHGNKIISNFLFRICKCRKGLTERSFIKKSIEEIRGVAGDERVVLGLSGGVDSSVTAALLSRAIGGNLYCIFIDNGLLRKDEAHRVKQLAKKHLKTKFIFVEAQRRFLTALKGVSDPEKKRKIIGRVFIRTFEEAAEKIGNVRFLAQGTLYPDIIESKSAFGGPSAVIKSHHNVGGLPRKMGLKIIEPLKGLFKDEARRLGGALGLPREIIYRQPFPGPGLAVRIIGEVTKERLAILRQADKILSEAIRRRGLYYKVWQSFAVLLPVRTVGVMGDKRTYENVIAIRTVESRDGMTADWARLPYAVLESVSSKIINEVKGVNRVVYDISTKPPGTIEWE